MAAAAAGAQCEERAERESKGSVHESSSGLSADLGEGKVRRQQRRVPGAGVEGPHAPVRLDDETGLLDFQVSVSTRMRGGGGPCISRVIGPEQLAEVGD